MQCHDAWNAWCNDVLEINEIVPYVFVLSMLWCMDVMYGHVNYYATVLLESKKINPWALLRMRSASLHVLKCWWVSICYRNKLCCVRETLCITCRPREILLGNPEKLGDFHRGILGAVTGSFVPPGMWENLISLSCTLWGILWNSLNTLSYFLNPLVIVFLFFGSSFFLFICKQ